MNSGVHHVWNYYQSGEKRVNKLVERWQNLEPLIVQYTWTFVNRLFLCYYISQKSAENWSNWTSVLGF